MIQPGATPEGSLLLTLEEISQLVSHSRDPAETLNNIVRLIQGRFHTDVCSVYLLEPESAELVLGATIGLKPESVGQIRMHLNEGLTGLVAQEMAPVMVDDAFQHSRFKYFPEAGEDPYHAFLGVPLVEGGAVQGVLVVQTRERRKFSPSETRMLVTVASQLAPLVGEAGLLKRVAAVAHPESHPAGPAAPPLHPALFHGVAISPGIGLGEAYVVDRFEEWSRPFDRPSSDPANEPHRLNQAIENARAEITRLSQRISELVGEDHGAILQSQLMIMQDRTIEQDLNACLYAGCTAEGALLHTLDKYVAAFQKLTSPLFQERVYDVKDVFRRILWHLRPHAIRPETGEGRLVLVAREASVLDLFAMDLDRLAAVVIERGGSQSHAAILARSLGIPMVGQVPEFVSHVQPGQQLLVDGTSGVIYIEPSTEIIVAYWDTVARRHKAARGKPAADAATDPGTCWPRVEANINLLCEVHEAVQQRAMGVGLFRSEFLFLARRTLPSEEEQVDIYRKLLTLLDGRPATIRTFDLRPDKLAHTAHLISTGIGTLDWRLVLEAPSVQKLFKEQVRAILRAATAGPARILVPLVTRTELLDYIIHTVAEARAELRREGLEFGREVPVGIMIEVPAAVTMADTWVDQVDFFALGTNDLMATTLGMDRDDPVAASHHDPLHPALLRMVYHVVGIAHQHGKQVTVCGEMAADPEGALALAAFGIDAISVAVPQLGPVRDGFRNRRAEVLPELASELTHLRRASDARELIRRQFPV